MPLAIIMTGDRSPIASTYLLSVCFIFIVGAVKLILLKYCMQLVLELKKYENKAVLGECKNVNT